MATDVDIANLALYGLGANPIQSFRDDSHEAKIINAVYALCRDDVLMAHPWNFATKRVTFARLDEDPSPVTSEFSLVYQVPTETLRVLWIEPKNARYTVENGGRLYTNVGEPLKGGIIERVTDPARFSQAFIHVLVARLRAEISLALTGNRATMQQYYTIYLQKLQEARTTDGMEGSPEVEDVSPLALARVTGPALTTGLYYDGVYAR